MSNFQKTLLRSVLFRKVWRPGRSPPAFLLPGEQMLPPHSAPAAQDTRVFSLVGGGASKVFSDSSLSFSRAGFDDSATCVPRFFTSWAFAPTLFPPFSDFDLSGPFSSGPAAPCVKNSDNVGIFTASVRACAGTLGAAFTSFGSTAEIVAAGWTGVVVRAGLF